MNEPQDDPDDFDVEVEKILDPGEYTQRRRLKELFDLRQDIKEVRKGIEWSISTGDLDRDSGNAIYASVLESYLHELEPLALNQYPETGHRYWYEVDLGTHQFTPPEEFTDIQGNVNRPPQPVTMEFQGLSSIITTETVFELTFTQKVSGRQQAPTEQTTIVEYTIPKPVLDTAYRQANMFLSDIGMDVDPEEETPNDLL